MRLWVGTTTICIGLFTCWIARAVPGKWSMVYAQTGEKTADQIAEIAAASLLKAEKPPVFELDKSWPKQPLPNNWGLGIVWAVAVDPRDHIWVLNQTAGREEQVTKAGKVPGPPVLEFDQQGNLLQSWGVPGQGGWTQGKGRPFPAQAMTVDHKNNVWVTEEARGHAAVKFSRDGKFLLQIGEVDKTGGSNDTRLLGGPSGLDVDPVDNEIYIADGYIVNQRVIVFDADTGAYKRHWGRYGLKPDDTFEAAKQPFWMVPSPFLVGKPNPPGSYPRFAHGVNVSRDGLVYVADRSHSMIYVHRKDGTYVKEAAMPGPINSVGFSSDPEQYYAYGTGNNASARMYILRRSDLQVLGSFKSDGQHYMGVDSKGNLYTCGLQMPQRFLLKEVPKRPARSR
jgi:DNA-binding beta-propeller fold protein YncE